MPIETINAVEWALQQTFTNSNGDICLVSKDTPQELTDKVREYFNTKSIPYDTFSFNDLIHFFN